MWAAHISKEMKYVVTQPEEEGWEWGEKHSAAELLMPFWNYKFVNYISLGMLFLLFFEFAVLHLKGYLS